ncbi:MAG: carboxymuconolactone decarboxylase family protein [Solirubrobacteraceae bacterium]
MSRAHGVSEQQLQELPRYHDSPAFWPLERNVLDLAVAMAHTPAEVPPALLAELRQHLDQTQLVELAAGIAWENYRARFNRVFGVGPVGYSAGSVCAVPERGSEAEDG